VADEGGGVGADESFGVGWELLADGEHVEGKLDVVGPRSGFARRSRAMSATVARGVSGSMARVTMSARSPPDRVGRRLGRVVD
jgi:hypothetical protein